MNNCLNIEIAGVTFSIRCDDPIDMRVLPPQYKAFLKKQASGIEKHVPVYLEIENIPDTAGMKKIFDTGQSWIMFADKDDYCVKLAQSGSMHETVWLALFNKDVNKVIIYCGNLLVRDTHKGRKIINPFIYPLDQILLMYLLSDKEGALLHAAGIGFNGKGYIFPGRSGAGKSTFTRHFIEKEGIDVLSDDRIAARKTGCGFRMFGTPWSGKEGIAGNIELPLCGIFFINKNEKNIIRKIKPEEAFKRLLPLTSIPWFDKKVFQGILDFCYNMLLDVPAYDFYCSPDSGAGSFFEQYIEDDKYE